MPPKDTVAERKSLEHHSEEYRGAIKPGVVSLLEFPRTEMGLYLISGRDLDWRIL